MNVLRRLFPVLATVILLVPGSLVAQAPEPVVHAILFYSPTCPHCHEVITEDLIPLQNRYGNRLVLMGMDTSQPWASNLYWEAIRHFKVPQEDWAVPLLIVGDEVLVGGFEIPDRFPEILQSGLAAGGIDLPDYPALVTFLREQDVLDPRYPDRLIARQAPAAPEEGAPPSDSAGAEPAPRTSDSLPVTDTGEVVDSVSGEEARGNPRSVGQDTAAVVEEPGQAGEIAEPSLPDSAQVADTASSSRQGRSEQGPGEPIPVTPEPDTGARAPSQHGAAPGARTAQDTAQGRESPGVETSGTGPRRDSVPGAMRALGMEEAARGLESMTVWDRFNLDPMGNGLSVMVLLGMILVVILRAYPPRAGEKTWPAWTIPVLVLVGAGVAAYLSFVEVTQAEAVCGPVGDCNTVNQSEYAYLFGVLPVGILGLAGYGMILVLWILGQTGRGEVRRFAALGLWGAALFGTLFSMYLTFLEPFVIGATCAWCLTSAVIMALLLWSTAPMAARVWPRADEAPDSEGD